MSLSSTQILFQVNGGETRTIAGASVTFPEHSLYSRLMAFTDGTGQAKAQKWGVVDISLAAGASQTVDLTACPWLNGTVNFSAIKGMLIENSNAEQEVDVVTLTGTPTGGTFTITVAGQVTSGLAYNAAASAVQTAVAALSTVGSGKVTVTGSAGGPYTVALSSTLGLKTVTASGAGLTGGMTPAAAAVRYASNLELGDDGTGTNVWSAMFKGTNPRIVVQPSEVAQKFTSTTGGYPVDSTHKSLLIKNAGAIAVTGILILLGEGT